MAENHEKDDEPQIADPDKMFEKYKDKWYNISTLYWSKQEQNDNGMLGGYSSLTEFDISSSTKIIEKYQNPPKNKKYTKLGNNQIADCGCGIGRVSHSVLSKYFKKIDLIDPVDKFIEEAKKNLADDNVEIRTFTEGIQTWTPDCEYDAYWIQWAIMYLTDIDAINFLQRCKQHLSKNGYIFIKDNISSSDIKQKREEATFYPQGCGICRAFSHYLSLFKKANIKVIEIKKQENWPDELLPVYIFVLQ